MLAVQGPCLPPSRQANTDTQVFLFCPSTTNKIVLKKFPSKPSPLKERTALRLESDVQHHLLLVKEWSEYTRLFPSRARGFPMN